MSDYSAWNDGLQPFYKDSALERLGIEVTDDLIAIPVLEGGVVYPHAQFDVRADGTLQRREAALELWNRFLRPAVEKGLIDEYSAANLLLAGTEGNPSNAELISKNPTQVQRVAAELATTIICWEQL